MREVLARAAHWVKMSRGTVRPVPPPEPVAAAMLEAPAREVPPLQTVVRAPVVTREGIITTQGYHSSSRLYYAPGSGLDNMPPVPEAPNEEEVAEAKRLLLGELLGDFPFADQASRANALALLLTPFLRPCIEGPTPLFLIDKPRPGSGATLLARVVALVATGDDPASIPPKADETELTKAITSTLLRSPAIVLLDNWQRLDSGALASALTATTWEDRLLGRSQNVRVANAACWATTGNNPRLSIELARRAVRIRLEPDAERPWLREGFRHPDLLEWATANRACLVWAALVLVQHWRAKGCPGPEKALRLGMFEAWARVVGGVLEATGIEGFLGNALDVYEEADDVAEAEREFISRWWQSLGEAEAGMDQLAPIAKAAGLIAEDAQGHRVAVTLGAALRRLQGQVFELAAAAVRVVRVRRKRPARYRLLRLDRPGGGEGSRGDVSGDDGDVSGRLFQATPPPGVGCDEIAPSQPGPDCAKTSQTSPDVTSPRRATPWRRCGARASRPRTTTPRLPRDRLTLPIAVLAANQPALRATTSASGAPRWSSCAWALTESVMSCIPGRPSASMRGSSGP